MPMHTPPHPGLSIRHDCLAPLGLNVTDAAQKLGEGRQQLSELVSGTAGFPPEMVVRLGKTFGR